MLGNFDEELGIAREMMGSRRVRPGAHVGDTVPVGDRHEFALALAIFAQHLHAPRALVQQRLGPMRQPILLVLVGLVAARSSTPYARIDHRRRIPPSVPRTMARPTVLPIEPPIDLPMLPAI